MNGQQDCWLDSLATWVNTGRCLEYKVAWTVEKGKESR